MKPKVSPARWKGCNSADPEVGSHVVIINGAEPGVTADEWSDPNYEQWDSVDNRITSIAHGGNRRLSPNQIQVAWVKLANKMFDRTTVFPDHVLEMQGQIEEVMRILHDRYPNLKIVFLSIRGRDFDLWDGQSATWNQLSPETAAYEAGFAVKWAIEKQINGDPGLNFDPARGPVEAPYMAWGPYIWANGANSQEYARSDGFEWLLTDADSDCTHPSADGKYKVAQVLLDFFKTNSKTCSWFHSDPGQCSTQPLPTPTSVPTDVPTPTPEPTTGPTPTPEPTLTPTIIPSPTIEPTATPTPTPGAGTNPPVIETNSLRNGSAGSYYSERLRGYDVDLGETLTMTYTGLPPGLNENNCVNYEQNSVQKIKCRLSGVPGASGSYLVTLTLTDSAGTYTTKTLTLIVD